MEIPKILLSVEEDMLKKLRNEKNSLNLLTIQETIRYIIAEYFKEKEK
jgi:chorismate mutase